MKKSAEALKEVLEDLDFKKFIFGQEDSYVVYEKEMLLQAEVYVYENDQKITRIYRSKWRTYRRYFCFRRNAIAMNFYQREGLEIQREDFDQATGEKEYVMIWSQK